MLDLPHAGLTTPHVSFLLPNACIIVWKCELQWIGWKCWDFYLFPSAEGWGLFIFLHVLELGAWHRERFLGAANTYLYVLGDGPWLSPPVPAPPRHTSARVSYGTISPLLLRGSRCACNLFASCSKRLERKAVLCKELLVRCFFVLSPWRCRAVPVTSSLNKSRVFAPCCPWCWRSLAPFHQYAFYIWLLGEFFRTKVEIHDERNSVIKAARLEQYK